MPSQSPPREIRRHLPLIAQALALTQVPALPLLLSSRPTSMGIALYAGGSVAAAAALALIGVRSIARFERIVALVRGYAEHGSLSTIEGSDPGGCVDQVKASLASLDRAVRSLESDAARDPLTGILNRRSCAARLEGDLARSRRGGIPFTVALFDLDDLKTINDGQGHAAGDAALRHIANVLQSVTREGDWVARWGGDEFLLALWGADAEAARLVAERVLAKLSADTATCGDVEVFLGASVGVGQAQSEDDSTRLFSRADKALFQAKRGGRNRVILA